MDNVVKAIYTVERGFTQWGEEIPMTFRVWRSTMRISNGVMTVLTWYGFNVCWRGVWVRLDIITERKA